MGCGASKSETPHSESLKVSARDSLIEEDRASVAPKPKPQVKQHEPQDEQSLITLVNEDGSEVGVVERYKSSNYSSDLSRHTSSGTSENSVQPKSYLSSSSILRTNSNLNSSQTQNTSSRGSPTDPLNFSINVDPATSQTSSSRLLGGAGKSPNPQTTLRTPATSMNLKSPTANASSFGLISGTPQIARHNSCNLIVNTKKFPNGVNTSNAMASPFSSKSLPFVLDPEDEEVYINAPPNRGKIMADKLGTSMWILSEHRERQLIIQ